MAERYCMRMVSKIKQIGGSIAKEWSFHYSDGTVETVTKKLPDEPKPQKLRGLETACYGAIVVASVFDQIGAGLMAL